MFYVPSSPPVSTAFIPTVVREVEASQPLPAISPGCSSSGQVYGRALLLVRLYGQPLSTIALDLPPDGLDASAVAAAIWDALGTTLNDHLSSLGLPRIDRLHASGLPSVAKNSSPVSATDMPFVSVVVATRDRPEDLSRCLQSLLALAYPAYEIVLVDNAPRTNATVDVVAAVAANTDRVRYVREDRPGLSWARNCGLHVARGSIIAYTDDDVQVDPYWLTKLVNGFACAERVACVTGLTMPAELETPAQAWFEQFGGFARGFQRQVFGLDTQQTDDPLFPYAPGRYGSGNNMAFTRAFLEEIGGFDPALGAGSPARGGEDCAAFVDVITCGYALVYEPSALAYHTHRRDFNGLHKQMYGYGTGLTAYLTRCVLRQPACLATFAAGAYAGLRHIFNHTSQKNQHKSADYPAELSRVEHLGMVFGPFAYLHGVCKAAQQRRTMMQRPVVANFEATDGQAMRLLHRDFTNVINKS